MKRLNYIGRRTAVAMVVIAGVAIGVRAFANNAALDDIAKDASRYGLMQKLCSTFVAINNETAPTVIESTLWVGTEKFGASAMSVAVTRETEQHKKEIKSLGLVQWCEKQRAILLSDPLEKHFLK